MREKEIIGNTNVEVSIVIPAYNSENTLWDTLNSLLAQNYPKDKYEIIVVDDGSTDSTYHIANQFKMRYKNNIRIRVFTKNENQGKGSAQNFGVNVSNGNYILTIDSDSIAPPNWIQTMVSSLKTCDVVSGVYYAYNPSNIIEKMQNALFISKFKYSKNPMVIAGTNFGFKKSVFYEIGGFNEKTPSTTFDFVIRAKQKGFKFCVNKDSYVYTRVHNNLISLIVQLLRWRENPLKLYFYERKIQHLVPFIFNFTMSLILPLSIIFGILHDTTMLLVGLLILLIGTSLQHLPKFCRLLVNSEYYWGAYLLIYILFEAFIMKPLYLPYWVYRILRPRHTGSFRR
ncbi:glycosyltransferase [Pyrococcus kukulkanii]|uniref:glycosyltransferase n=1 Tax=Pyrococcus kukulkanii TaxID=1609559 RepID=UPI003562C304